MTFSDLYKDLAPKLRASCVMPVIEIADATHAEPLAAALAEGGLAVFEFTLRTEAALPALTRAKKAFPELTIGMGTVLSARDAARSIEAGADFLVTPGVTPALLEKLSGYSIPTLPGVATVSEAMTAMAAGVKIMKFFPAEPAGGVAYIKSLAGPLPDAIFCPTGGVGRDRAAAYLALKNVICVGGSWVAAKADIAAGAWDKITENARFAASLRTA